mgnify:CR=1 FL=1
MVELEFNVIKLSIIDTGPGIHPSMRKKIFNEFTQIDYSHYKRGIGLGLAIVKKLAGKIGAYINLKSHLGLGSIFILCLVKRWTQYNGHLVLSLKLMNPSGWGVVWRGGGGWSIMMRGRFWTDDFFSSLIV